MCPLLINNNFISHTHTYVKGTILPSFDFEDDDDNAEQKWRRKMKRKYTQTELLQSVTRVWFENFMSARVSLSRTLIAFTIYDVYFHRNVKKIMR